MSVTADVPGSDTVLVSMSENAGEADLSVIGRALADASRASILSALMTGTAWTIGELATHVGIARSTASEHVTRLVTAGLVRVTRQGRHAYVVLAGPEIASALEVLGLLAPPRPVVPSLRGQRHARELAAGRTCYRHLAGRLGVDLADAFLAAGLLTATFDLTDSGRDWFDAHDIDTRAFLDARPVRPCLDWTERRPHMAGPAADRLTAHAFHEGWIRRGSHPRSVVLTGDGAQVFTGVSDRRLEGRDAQAR